jgi:putative molybdopterin biosynthesis protein
MPAKNQKKRRIHFTPTRTSEVLDVRMTAELLTVSPDTVYDLFKRGELPGRKVGRKRLTTRNAVLRWIESSKVNGGW